MKLRVLCSRDHNAIVGTSFSGGCSVVFIRTTDASLLKLSDQLKGTLPYRVWSQRLSSTRGNNVMLLN